MPYGEQNRDAFGRHLDRDKRMEEEGTDIYDEIRESVGPVNDIGDLDRYNAAVEEHEQQQEEIRERQRNNNGWCYLTTACTQFRGLPDNCLELTVLRRFRDDVLMQTPDGKKAVSEYYEFAPLIVKKILERGDAHEIFEEIYGVVVQTVRNIESEKFEEAFRSYKDMSLGLKKKLLDNN